MESLDLDGSGGIDYTEFITGAVDKVSFLNKDNLKAAFQMIDKDHSGMITMEELKFAFDTKGEKEEGLWEEIMHEVDANNDG